MYHRGQHPPQALQLSVIVPYSSYSIGFLTRVIYATITKQFPTIEELCHHFQISVSPDGKYELTLQAVGEPDWPFGSASGRLVLKEGEDKISQTDFELHNDGGSFTSNCWKVTWYEDHVEVILSGEEQFDEQVILYFDGTKEIQQLTDVADIEVEYPSGERLDESRVITEQSFDVELNGWGEVQFVSYLPLMKRFGKMFHLCWQKTIKLYIIFRSVMKITVQRMIV